MLSRFMCAGIKRHEAENANSYEKGLAICSAPSLALIPRGELHSPLERRCPRCSHPERSQGGGPARSPVHLFRLLDLAHPGTGGGITRIHFQYDAVVIPRIVVVAAPGIRVGLRQQIGDLGAAEAAGVGASSAAGPGGSSPVYLRTRLCGACSMTSCLPGRGLARLRRGSRDRSSLPGRRHRRRS